MDEKLLEAIMRFQPLCKGCGRNFGMDGMDVLNCPNCGTEHLESVRHGIKEHIEPIDPEFAKKALADLEHDGVEKIKKSGESGIW